MPRINDLTVQKTFKKKAYRSWDKDLIQKIKFDEAPENDVIKIHEAGTEKKAKRLLKTNTRDNKLPKFLSDQKSAQKAIEALGGNEKKIFFHVINICAAEGSLATGKMIGAELTKAVSTTRNGRETAIKRLSKKGLLKRKRGKKGVKGTLCLCVTDLIKKEALAHLRSVHTDAPKSSQIGDTKVQSETSHKMQLDRNNNNKHNTAQNTELPASWLNINTEPLEKNGFSMAQLKQLYSQSLNTPEIVQESIHHFAFALINNPKVKKYADPINVLMGVLRKGQAWVEPRYRSPQEIAQRELLAHKKAEVERLKRLEKEATELAFEEWREKLTQEQLAAITRTEGSQRDFIPEIVKIRAYFEENIWPEKRPNYLVENS